MKIKIFSFVPLAKPEQFGFNAVFQPEVTDTDERGVLRFVPLGQFLIVGLRVMYGKIYAPAMQRNGTYIPTLFLDPRTAGALYEALVSLPDAPTLVEPTEAVKPLLIGPKIIERFAV